MIIGFAGEIYQTPRINVNIVHGQCSDGMSDRTYPDKVQVTSTGSSSMAAAGFEAFDPRAGLREPHERDRSSRQLRRDPAGTSRP